MATSLFKFAVFLFIALVLFSPNENNIAEAKLCQKLSKTFSGICIRKKPCKSACAKEGAVDGSCHTHGIGRACFCYFRC
ncbi:defensin NsD7-like [Prosopis cineraria]|uniref:defensin NsD7-like n=1 Tax=Prosopis cineraria TaxID=364024 RepID=UPI00240F46BF|nr:defensin NsD7-like [Prosopis cineraria]